jgi:hypothetical protein
MPPELVTFLAIGVPLTLVLGSLVAHLLLRWWFEVVCEERCVKVKLLRIVTIWSIPCNASPLSRGWSIEHLRSGPALPSPEKQMAPGIPPRGHLCFS